jgi:hypothetical protein
MISHLLFPSAVRRATYSRVRLSLPLRTTTQIRCRARLAFRLPSRLSRCLTTLPEEASTGETPQRPRERGLLVQALRIVSGHNQERSGVMRTDGRQGDQPRSDLSHQPVQLRVKLGNLLREDLMTAGHRTERELGRRANVIGITAEAETGTGSDELLGGELAQTVP